MNYIKHLNYFFNKIQYDNDIAPSQIALYLALFQCWNKQRFENPIYIIRDEVMRLSKITSCTTYHRSMKVLHKNGYIIYEPSYNPYVGSKVFFKNLTEEHKTEVLTIPNIEEDKALTSSKNNEGIEKVMNKAMERATVSIYKHINNKQVNNKLSLSKEREKFSKNDEINFPHENDLNINLPKNEMQPKEKSSAKKEKGNIPTLDEVKEFFQEKNGSLLEAEKFFNYYEATGWLVGGKSKMKKWRAAASNWIINAKASSLNVFGAQKPLDTSKNKRYDEPL